MNKKWFLSLALMFAVVLLAACNNGEESVEENNDEPETQEEETAGDNETATEGGENTVQQPELPEPNLEGIPEVVAQVNGEEIGKEEFENAFTGQFQQIAMQAQMSGQASDIDQEQLKTQIVESMIGQKLLIQEADKRNFNVSDDEINKVIDGIVEQNGMESQDALMAALEEQGTDKEEVLSQVEKQVKINKLIEDESGDIAPTDAEVQEYYDQLVAQQEEMDSNAEIPSFDEVKSTIEQQLVSQKQNKVVQTLVTTLRENAEITNNL
ncbi:hypothetical protein GCM10011351_24590 [Paraliobacillus quinghaiensis]|uniref:Peptidylprolyl isomerase n=1 Tax=Paraliobacillus quinghaiensis TaxID=470815 RepID=A0A917TVI8_9BACI|nr:SurA N-terminal domain-containing protein [Paraliobacillus quinghaiensis]GGM37477.1 hypothetical protein GCM10011351_24590 [Paraliobacillus quinghaiensis]